MIIYTPFSKPETNKTIWIEGFQHYLAGTWRGIMWHTTDKFHPRNRKFVLCVSKCGQGVWFDDEGNASGDPFPLNERDKAWVAEKVAQENAH